MQESKLKYIYLIVLSLIWGSSFILIKKALGQQDGQLILTPLQLGALRTILAGIILVIIGWKSFKNTQKKDWKWLLISGLLGTFFPAFLFAYAQTQIDSAVSAILNATVPLVTLIIGAVVFGIAFSRKQLLGVSIGLIGAIGLVVAGMDSHPDQNYAYAGFIIIACLCYASNVNIIKRYMQHISPLAIATGNFVFIVPPALVVFLFSGGLQLEYTSVPVLHSLGYVMILCVFGTVMAKVMFNKLVQLTSPVFASSVTYLMPIIGLCWGLLDGEFFNLWQIVATVVIIVAVILVTSSKKKPASN